MTAGALDGVTLYLQILIDKISRPLSVGEYPSNFRRCEADHLRSFPFKKKVYRSLIKEIHLIARRQYQVLTTISQ